MPQDDATLSAASAGSQPDITTRLRQTRADMIGTADEQHYWDCHEAAGEIEKLRRRLRIADAALRTDHGAAPAARARTDGGSVGTDKAEPLTHRGTGDTFSPIAKRETDRPDAIATPKTPSTPSEGSVRNGCTSGRETVQ